jgi:hypothetical protein
MKVAGTDARTLASYLAHQVKSEAVEQRASVVVVDDAGLDVTMRASLEADDFVFADEAWLRVVCPEAGTRDELRGWLAAARTRTSRPGVARYLAQLEADGVLDLPAAALERLLWPVKVLDASLPTFVVPVKATWAKHLFDADLAGLDLVARNSSHTGYRDVPVRYREYFAWVLRSAERLHRPVPYKHPTGAVVWVLLADSVSGKIAEARATRACSARVPSTTNGWRSRHDRR